MLQPMNDWDNCAKFFAKRRKLESLTPQETEGFLILSCVVQWVDNVLKNHKPVIIDYKKPKRSVSPSFKSYYAKGHSPLNVGPGRIPDSQMRISKNPYI